MPRAAAVGHRSGLQNHVRACVSVKECVRCIVCVYARARVCAWQGKLFAAGFAGAEVLVALLLLVFGLGMDVAEEAADVVAD